MENSYRATFAQIFGGIAIGIDVYYTWKRITIAENNLKVSQEGKITERFTRAFELDEELKIPLKKKYHALFEKPKGEP
jgi:hypothetical protein